MNYDAVVFDNDGVLVRITEGPAVQQAIADTFAEFGVENPPPEHIDRLFGVTLTDLLDICSQYDLDPAAFWERRDRNIAAAQIELIEAGVKDLYDDVSVLHDLDVPMGVVSNNQHQTVKYVLDHYDLSDQFHTVYGRQPTLEDVTRKKPNPHYLQQALTDLAAEDALYVGDSPTDVMAARLAGVDAAFLRRPHREGATLPVEPTVEVPDLETLVDWLVRSNSDLHA